MSEKNEVWSNDYSIYMLQLNNKLHSLANTPNIGDYSMDVKDTLRRAAYVIHDQLCKENNGTVPRED